MVKYFKDKFHNILNYKIDLLFCNKEEAESFTEENDFKKCCRKMLEFSEMVVITKGDEGSLIISNSGENIEIEPNNVNALDTVGAGDTYAGAFLYGINNGLSLKKSGELASSLSSKVVTKLGPRLDINVIESIKQTMI